MKEWMNDKGFCRGAPGYAGSAKKLLKKTLKPYSVYYPDSQKNLLPSGSWPNK